MENMLMLLENKGKVMIAFTFFSKYRWIVVAFNNWIWYNSNRGEQKNGL